MAQQCQGHAPGLSHPHTWVVPASPQVPPGFSGWCWDIGQPLLSTRWFLMLAGEKEQQGRAH